MVTMLVYLIAGNVTAEMLPRFAVVAPAMLIPALIGARVYHRIDEAHFRAIVLTLLTVSGVMMLSSGLPTVLGRIG